jgi:transcriptional regulator with XRE-family HTH domain
LDTIESNFGNKMYSLMNSVDFANWLQDEMSRHGWSNSELARQAGVTRGAIGNILRGDRNTGSELCQAIARAFNLPAEQVFQKAGLLPPVAEKNAKIEELAHLANLLGNDDDIQDLIEIAKIRLKRKEENKVHKQKSSRSYRPARTAS